MQYIWLFNLNKQTKTLSNNKIIKLFVSGQLTKYEKVLRLCNPLVFQIKEELVSRQFWTNIYRDTE